MKMDDLISREQVLTLLTERMRDTAFNNAGEDAGEVLVDIVNNRLRRWVNELPLEQKTVIIRCKDCKFSHEDTWMGRMLCERYTDSHETDKDGFCSKGKRRT